MKNLLLLISIFASLSQFSLAQELTFEPIVNYDTNENPRVIESGDLNADGIDDLVVVCTNSDCISVYMGNEDGVFSSQETFSVGDAPNDVRLLDIDNDTILDVITLNKNSKNISVHLGEGDGTFSFDANYSVNGTPNKFDIADLNNDMIVDIAIAISSSSTIEVLFGQSDGSFGELTDILVGNIATWDIELADFNNDGNIDAVVTHYFENYGISIFYGNGTGSLEFSTILPAGMYSIYAECTDLNNDGYIDLLITNGLYVSVHMGTTDGGFGEEIIIGEGNNTFGLTTQDLNSDGFLDLLIANQNFNNPLGNIEILLGNEENVFETNLQFDAEEQTHDIITGLFNNDSLYDVAVVNPYSNSISVFLQENNSVDSTNSTNIQSVILENSLVLIPNPTKNILTIKNYNSEINIVGIYRLTGEIVKSVTVFNNTIDVSDLVQGVYLAKFSINNKTITERFIKH